MTTRELSPSRFSSAAALRTANPSAPRCRYRKLAGAALLALLPLATIADTGAQAEGNWMVRLRGTYLDMADKSDPVGGMGAADRIGVDNKWIPELDVSYFFTPHIAAELVLTVPQKQNVYLDGGRIGTFRHLPPSLLLQYHFTPHSTWRPYVGAGINVTRIWDAELAGNTLALDRWSVGPVLQIGMDYRLTRNWFLNADIKKTWISSDVKAAGATLSQAKLDPWLFSVGIGYRF